MESRSKVEKLLKELEKAEWFSTIGEPLAIRPPSGLAVSRVDSWKPALRVMRSRQTKEFLVRSQNFLYLEQDNATKGTKSEKKLVTEFNNWIDATRGKMKQLADSATHGNAVPAEVGATYPNVLSWMIQKACVIYQYDEYIKENP